MLEIFGQVYMYILMFMGVCIGITFAVLGYGFKGFLAGAFFTIALGMMSVTITVIALLIFVNVVLKSVSSKANKILIPLLVIGLVLDVFRYTDKKEETKPKDEEKAEYQFIEEANNSEDSITNPNQESEESSNTDYTNNTSESITANTSETETVQGDLDSVPVLGASNTVESAREQIGYLIMYYLETYTAGDITSLDNYVYPSSSFYSEQKSYMESLISRGIILDLIDYGLISMEQIADMKYEVNVEEFYSIDDPEKGFSDTQQTGKYTVELIDGEFYITGLEL